ncbi:hypothetical protein EI94DRAFT_684801 [Lactarius quietus]|nr:hypothetical protein EI94DRAFT_684801 [Lactarius quietus]
MLWEASLTTRTFKSLPRRHKHAYSSRSSSISNRELATTSTHASEDKELRTGELRSSSVVVVTEGIQSHRTMEEIGVGPNPLSNNGNQAIAEFCPSMSLPNWLDNTLATLPSSHPVRRLILPVNRPIVRNLVDQNAGVSDERVVFAFQAPPCEGHLLGHAGSDGYSGASVGVTVPKPSILNSDSRTGSSDSRGNPFEVTHNGSVEFRENTFAVLRTVPFSTPGPGCAISQAPAARYPWEGNPILPRTTDNGSQEAMDPPPPFSTPGPFASPRLISSHVSDSHAGQVYPTIQKSSAIPILSFHSTKSDRIDTPFPVQDGCGQFSALPNLMPGCSSNISGLSSSPTLATEPTFPRDGVSLRFPQVLPGFHPWKLRVDRQ